MNHIDRAEERVESMLAEAPRASSDVAEAVRRASVLLYRATQRINDMAAAETTTVEKDDQGNPVRIKVPEEVWKGFDEAFGYLIDCVEVLEEAIDPRLLDAEEQTKR